MKNICCRIVLGCSAFPTATGYVRLPGLTTDHARLPDPATDHAKMPDPTADQARLPRSTTSQARLPNSAAGHAQPVASAMASCISRNGPRHCSHPKHVAEA